MNFKPLNFELVCNVAMDNQTNKTCFCKDDSDIFAVWKLRLGKTKLQIGKSTERPHTDGDKK